MLKATKRIIIISELLNKYGFRALVDGIDLTQYDRNPIMLWMHKRAFGDKKTLFLPLGNVIELKVEVIEGVGKCLTGLPVFDDTDDFAVSIFNKLENGTLRMASAGLIPVEWSDAEELIVQGQRSETLVRSILEEVSIVDIGADNNALTIALYDENHNRIELSSSNTDTVIPLIQSNSNIIMSKIELTAAKAASLLGGKEIETADQFETEILGMVQLAASQKTQIEALTLEKTEMQTKLENQEKIQLNAKIETLVQGAVDSRKITADEKPLYVALAAKDYESVEKIFGAKSGFSTVQSQLEDAKSKDKNIELYSKSYDQLFESGDLEKVKLSAPDEYARIFKDKFNVEPKK